MRGVLLYGNKDNINLVLIAFKLLMSIPLGKLGNVKLVNMSPYTLNK